MSSKAMNSLDNWRTLPIQQQPEWPDAAALSAAREVLSALPPLVFAGEVDRLRQELSRAAEGKSFVLQGGDCAESFKEVNADNISGRVKTILQMAVVLTYGASMPVLKMGRMAGQFAKPRSNPFETVEGRQFPVYRGDIVNGYGLQDRTPDPQRMLKAYQMSAATLNLIRAFTQGGFADLRQVHSWNRGFAANSAIQKYEYMANDIDRAIAFMEACGAYSPNLDRTELFVCHEGLLLEYERALTRIDSRTGLPYDTSGHFIWIGERTRQLNGAHVDFFSRIQNPLGIKLSQKTTVEEMLALADKLDPQRIPGRLTFITRMGAGNIRQKLPELLAAAQREGLCPVWVCDPMHGNTVTTEQGYKTRRFDDILDEVQGFFQAHRQVGTYPGGLHVELTGNDVTECTGGADLISEEDLKQRYESLCDPRLNHRQSLELSFLVAEELKAHKTAK